MEIIKDLYQAYNFNNPRLYHFTRFKGLIEYEIFFHNRTSGWLGFIWWNMSDEVVRISQICILFLTLLKCSNEDCSHLCIGNKQGVWFTGMVTSG